MKSLACCLTLAVALVAATPILAADNEGDVLRVCADPNNLPLSSRDRSGYENKIAELFAQDLGWKLEYTWWPQRIGFIRNTLKARQPNSDRYKCDLIIGVPEGYDLAATTQPYYRSVYAMAYVKGRGLDDVHAPDDLLRLPPEKLKSLKFGAFGGTPPVDWLLEHHLIDQVVPYQRQTGDPEQYTGEIIDHDLVAGRIDVAFVWGPIAGYFGRKIATPAVAVIPFRPDPQIRFDYAMAMGTRFGEKEWQARVEQFIERNRAKIQAILVGYGVPLLDDAGRPIVATQAAAAAGSR